MPFLESVVASIDGCKGHPYDIPSIRSINLNKLELHPKVTFFIGENGSGKSTLLEAIADKWGLAAQSGNRSQSLNSKNYATTLANKLTISRNSILKATDGFFLRAESLYNFATELEELNKIPYCGHGFSSYGGTSLHHQSHGESFFSIFMNRFGNKGIYMLDEPEAALSIKRQLAFLVRLNDLCNASSQFIIATHSPIILAYPECYIYEFSEKGISRINYQDSETYQLTKRFVNDREQMIENLFKE